jgi:tetratricopeptide (TPR) repeat protein
MRLDPKDAGTCNALAWALATYPEAKLRDGEKAVEYASKACKLSRWKSPLILETLAAAHAECGHFDQAVSWEKKALDLAPDEHKARFRSRLELYQANKPFRTGVAG